MSDKNSAPRVLHCHSTFSAGGKEMRCVQLMNAFGQSFDHTIICDDPAQMDAKDHIAKGVRAHFRSDFPPLKGWPTPGRLVAIAQAIKPFDLVLTYNWGAMDVVMAHTVFGDALKLPPLIHHEDGFNEDEVDDLKSRRNFYRRIALGRTHRLVVPSQTLYSIAVEKWKQPDNRILRIPNGVDTKAFARKPKPGSFRVVKREGERWIGTLAGLRPVKQLHLLVKACGGLPENWHLVILGDGPQREAIQAVADELEMSHRVHLPGTVGNPEDLIGLLDIFALSSQSEQFPLSVVEAMAASLPVAAPDVGDIRSIVSEANRPFIASSNAPEALGSMIEELAANEGLRSQIGAANQDKAKAQFDSAQMIEAYRSLYCEAIGQAP